MLFRKMCRDLLLNKAQFISIFLMSFLGLLIFVGLDAEVAGIYQNMNAFYEDTNLADLWVMGTSFQPEDEKSIEELSSVENAQRRLVLDGKAQVDEERDMQMNFLTGSQISKVHLIEGEPFDPEENGVWLDVNFVIEQGLQIGDVITLKVQNVEFEEVIKGTVYHSEYVYYLPDANAMMPEYGSYGFAFMGSDEFPIREELAFNQIVVDSKRIDSTDGVSEEERLLGNQLKTQIEQVLKRDGIVVSDKSQMLSYQMFDAELKQHETMAFSFPFVFLLIAVLGIVTTMARMTANQRTQIGTLKALGFSKRKITWHYVFYGFFLSALGAVFGAFVGYTTIPDALFGTMKMVYLLPNWGKSFSGKAFAAITLAVAISSLASYMACRKELVGPPAETLKPAVPKKIKHSSLEKTKFWLSMSFSSQWNLRDILRNKIRTIMGMVGVIGCTMLMLCAFGCLDTVQGITNWMYGELMTCESKILLEEGTSLGMAQDYANAYSGQMVQESGIEAFVGDKRKTGSVTIIDSGNYLNFQDQQLNKMKLSENGIAMSYKMASGLGIGVGDFVRWHLIGEKEWEYTRVEQIYRTPSSQGITMRRETFENLEHSFLPNSILTNVAVSESLVDKEEVIGVQAINEMMDALESNMALMNMMVGILIFAAVILGVVVLYNLGVLSFVEKTREIATLKVLGFSSNTIRGILQKQNIWITSMGILVGLPLGYLFLCSLFLGMPDSMDYVATVKLPSYLYSIIGTYLVSILVNFVLSGRVKTINMVDALKGTE